VLDGDDGAGGLAAHGALGEPATGHRIRHRRREQAHALGKEQVVGPAQFVEDDVRAHRGGGEHQVRAGPVQSADIPVPGAAG